jgi:spermidine synthase
VEIDGVEIDPAIVDLGRRHFAMNEKNLRVHVNDGRAFLGGCGRRYDWVVVDTYQGSDIPFHLITKEFFQQVRQHLTPEGVLSVNIAWWSPEDTELLERVVATVRASFPSVYVVTGISDRSGAVLLAGGENASPENMLRNARAVGHGGLLEIAEETLCGASPELSEIETRQEPLTDDRAPVARIADRLYRRERQSRYEAERRAVGGD